MNDIRNDAVKIFESQWDERNLPIRDGTIRDLCREFFVLGYSHGGIRGAKDVQSALMELCEDLEP